MDQLCANCIGSLSGSYEHHAECDKCLNKDLVKFVDSVAQNVFNNKKD